MKNVRAFAMATSPGLTAQLIIHWDGGHDTVAEMDYQELKELAFLATHALEEMNAECRADEQAERDSYERGLALRESAAEAEYQRHGYDDIPF
jgi:arginine utilization protein RocB